MRSTNTYVTRKTYEDKVLPFMKSEKSEAKMSEIPTTRAALFTSKTTFNS